MNSIDLSTVTVLGSNPTCLTFPATARLTRAALVPGALRLQVTHAKDWPLVKVSDTDPAPVQVATLWIFLQIHGAWFATGAERLREGQIAGDSKPEDPDLSKWIGSSWLYDTNRWGVMTGYVPQPGDPVGLMVVAGSTRSDDQTPTQERTPVVVIAWPGAGGDDPVHVLWTEGVTPPVDPPVDPPTPPDPPKPPLPDVLALILARFDKLDAAIDAIRQQPSPVVTLPPIVFPPYKVSYLGTATPILPTK